MLHDPTRKPLPNELQGNSLLDSLARRYYGSLRSFFPKGTHNGADTEGLVQPVFVRLAQSRQQGEVHNPDWDQAFLKGLYNTRPADRLGVARSMADEIVP